MWFLYLYDFKLFLGHVRQKVELLWCLGSRSPGGLGQTAVFHISISYFTFFFEIVTTWLFGGKHFFFRLRQDWKIQIKPDLLIASCSKSFVLFHANFLIKDFTGLLHLTNLIERAYFHFLSEDRLLNLTDNNIVFVTMCCRFHKAIIWFTFIWDFPLRYALTLELK